MPENEPMVWECNKCESRRCQYITGLAWDAPPDLCSRSPDMESAWWKVY